VTDAHSGSHPEGTAPGPGCGTRVRAPAAASPRLSDHDGAGRREAGGRATASPRDFVASAHLACLEWARARLTSSGWIVDGLAWTGPLPRHTHRPER
jgi:hypothetical protein